MLVTKKIVMCLFLRLPYLGRSIEYPNINPCDLCQGGYVPASKEDTLVNTTVAGELLCGGLEHAMAEGVLASHLCPDVVNSASGQCCELWENIYFDDFDKSWGNWIYRNAAARKDTFASTFNKMSARIKGESNNGGDSYIMSDAYVDVGDYNQFRISFYYRVTGYDLNDYFVVEYTVDGSLRTWKTLQEFHTGTDFIANDDGSTEYFSGYLVSEVENSYQNIHFRILLEANERDDKIWVDDVTIEGIWME